MKTLENTSIKIMTPGPTQVADSVYHARSLRTTNPDLDPAFYEYYKENLKDPKNMFMSFTVFKDISLTER